MFPETWRRVLLACTGDIRALRPALGAYQAALPDAEITLLVPVQEREAVPGWASEVLAPVTFWTLELPEQLRAAQFDAALILTAPGDSPHGLGYLCALAGVPERVGVSSEFGGQALTAWIKPRSPEPAHDLLQDICTIPDCAIQERN